MPIHTPLFVIYAKLVLLGVVLLFDDRNEKVPRVDDRMTSGTLAKLGPGPINCTSFLQYLPWTEILFFLLQNFPRYPTFTYHILNQSQLDFPHDALITLNFHSSPFLEHFCSGPVNSTTCLWYRIRPCTTKSHRGRTIIIFTPYAHFNDKPYRGFFCTWFRTQTPQSKWRSLWGFRLWDRPSTYHRRTTTISPRSRHDPRTRCGGEVSESDHAHRSESLTPCRNDWLQPYIHSWPLLKLCLIGATIIAILRTLVHFKNRLTHDWMFLFLPFLFLSYT